MIGTPAFEDLVNRTRDRKTTGRDPYTLLLGQDCANAAGASVATVSQQLFEYTNRRLGVQPLFSLAASGGGTPETLQQAIAKLPREQRSALLRPFYARLPVPLFYQDLARLIRDGYFTQIFTTNIDDLLEQALSGPIGLTRGKDYEVVSVADPETYSPADFPPTPDGLPVTIFKLHGDLTRADAVLRPEDIQSAIYRQRHLIKEELTGDLIIFGYTGESPPTEAYLARVPRSELWWVSESQTPTPGVMAAGKFKAIAGDAAAPSQFFSRLYEEVQRAPLLSASVRPLIARGEPIAAEAAVPDDGEAAAAIDPDQDEAELLEALTGAGFTAAAAGADPDQDEAELLEGQIRRATRLLVSLRRSSPSGKVDPALAKQIEYQTREIVQLQDRYRALKPNREKVLLWVDSMVQSVGGGDGVEPSTKAFLRNQRDVLYTQFGDPNPDHAVIGAVLCAMTSIGSRLDIVDRKALRGLIEFTPKTLVT
jgi:hypothetical protein